MIENLRQCEREREREREREGERERDQLCTHVLRVATQVALAAAAKSCVRQNREKLKFGDKILEREKKLLK